MFIPKCLLYATKYAIKYGTYVFCSRSMLPSLENFRYLLKFLSVNDISLFIRKAFITRYWYISKCIKVCNITWVNCSFKTLSSKTLKKKKSPRS